MQVEQVVPPRPADRDGDFKSKDKMPWHYSWAKYFMRIARNEAIRSGHHDADLPKDLNNLASLAGMDAPKSRDRSLIGQPFKAPRLLKAIKAGKVHPAMSRFDVQQVRAIYGPEPPYTAP